MYEVKVQGETGTQAAHSAVEINIYWGLERVLLIRSLSAMTASYSMLDQSQLRAAFLLLGAC